MFDGGVLKFIASIRALLFRPSCRLSRREWGAYPISPQIPLPWLDRLVITTKIVATMGHIDGKEVAKHTDKKSCWIVLDSKAYDVTNFVFEHPGGAPIILRNAGTVSK
jgi:hypothetical protein